MGSKWTYLIGLTTELRHLFDTRWYTHHIPWQLVTWQIFDVFVLRINDLCQLPPFYHLFVNPHVHHRVKPVGGFDIVANYFGNGGTPKKRSGEMTDYENSLQSQTWINLTKTWQLKDLKPSLGLQGNVWEHNPSTVYKDSTPGGKPKVCKSLYMLHLVV